jgi:hypothetical protein
VTRTERPRQTRASVTGSAGAPCVDRNPAESSIPRGRRVHERPHTRRRALLEQEARLIGKEDLGTADNVERPVQELDGGAGHEARLSKRRFVAFAMVPACALCS